MAALRDRAKALMEAVAAELTEVQGGKRRIVPALWPSPEFRDFGIRGDLAEFAGQRFEEQETFRGELAEARFVDVVADVMARRMETDERILVMGEDVHRLKGGTNGATRTLSTRFPDRTLGTPIAENAFVGLAGGIAIDGRYRPVVEFMYPDFMWVAADQVFNQIAKARHMFGGESDVPLVLRTKVAMGTGYGSQHSMDPRGPLRHLRRLAHRRPVHPLRLRGADEQRAPLPGPGPGPGTRGPLRQPGRSAGRGPRLLHPSRQGEAPAGGAGRDDPDLPRDGAPGAGRGGGPRRRCGRDRPPFAGPGGPRLGAHRGVARQDGRDLDRRAGSAWNVLWRHAGRRNPASLLRLPGPADQACARGGGRAQHLQGARTRRLRGPPPRSTLPSAACWPTRADRWRRPDGEARTWPRRRTAWRAGARW